MKCTIRKLLGQRGDKKLKQLHFVNHFIINKVFYFSGWLQTSAKDDININEAMSMLLKTVS